MGDVVESLCNCLAALNGFKSTKFAFQAGVRQGCPLAFLLCLFLDEALLRFKVELSECSPCRECPRMASQHDDDVDPAF